MSTATIKVIISFDAVPLQCRPNHRDDCTAQHTYVTQLVERDFYVCECESYRSKPLVPSERVRFSKRPNYVNLHPKKEISSWG